MFAVGDLIIYGTTGVCRVQEIAQRDLTGKGEQKLFYILQPVYQSCTISTPVDSGKVFMRPVITAQEARDLIAQIPHVEALRLEGLSTREMTDLYEQVISTHDCSRLVALIRAIHEKREAVQMQKRKFGALDERFFRRAEDLLHGELAVALGMKKDEIPAYIAQCIHEAEGGAQ